MKLLTLGIITMLSVNLSAGYEQYFKGYDYYGQAKYVNNGRTYTSPVFKESKLKNVTDKAALFYNIESQIKEEMRSRLIAELPYNFKLKRLNVNLEGPFILRLEGKSNGQIEARLGGFNLSINGKAEKSFYANAYFDFQTDVVWFKGTYDLSTGNLRGMLAEGFSTYVDVDADLLGFIDLEIGVESLEDDIRDFVNNAITKAEQGTSTMVFSLDQAIPNGEYVFNGRDIGAEVKNEVYSFFSDESLEIKMTRSFASAKQTQYVIGGRPVYGTTYYPQYKVELNVSDHLFLSAYSQADIHTEWVSCVPGSPYCEIMP